MVAFVKGTRTQPQCGFSYKVLTLLQEVRPLFHLASALPLHPLGCLRVSLVLLAGVSRKCGACIELWPCLCPARRCPAALCGASCLVGTLGWLPQPAPTAADTRTQPRAATRCCATTSLLVHLPWILFYSL